MTNQIDALIQADRKKMEQVLESARVYIDREYLLNLNNSANTVVSISNIEPSSIRMIRLTKIVYNSENIHSRLLSVFHVLSGVSNACFLLICGHETQTELYLGLRSDNYASMAGNALQSSINGNFPGTEFELLGSDVCTNVLSSLGINEKYKSTTIVSVSQIPSIRNDHNENGFSAQGIEHFIDAMRGEVYTTMILATPLQSKDAVSYRNNLENLYSALSSLDRISYQFSETSTFSEQHSVTSNITESITDSISTGYSYGTMKNSGVSHGSSPNIHVQFNSLGLGYGLQHGSFQSSGVQQGINRQNGQAIQKAIQNGKIQATGESTGQNKALTITQTNKMVVDLLRRIDDQISRIRECENYGFWECCTFFVAPAPDAALVAANIYKSLICGSYSGNEKSYMNKWDEKNPEGVIRILKSLQNAQMPVFRLSTGSLCNAGFMISGNELPLLMRLPLRSVCGVTVMQMASFGREVFRATHVKSGIRGVKIGKVYHMGRIEDTSVKLDIDSLSAHTLVTGTTGVGKSTLIAMLLSALHDVGVKILVVEPVKGEYKDLLGGIPQLQIFTTNPKKNRMLHINPFEFSKETHVLTHIDRIIEVFSVCWPLYAAQPALLRECIEEAYVRIGWDLSNSIFVHEGLIKYPDFRLLLQVVPEIIEKTHFVGESKGTYEGALLTRIAMLTHGIFGQVFNSLVSLGDEELFEHNTIIDLSEVGSQETISLIMGVLVVRLREYRTSKCKPQNQSLHHIMVLEEAHNIFQRNIRHNVEGGESISGKSVQMISQCIAEMRGYGQGIIIVDQSPSEIDLSAIRNTATKIVMRQPEATDQTAMAESLSLSKSQAVELPRLPEQVALVYQAGWIEPVMMRINDSKEKYKKNNTDIISYEILKEIRGFFVKLLLKMEQFHKYDIDILQKATLDIKNFNDGKKKDFIGLFKAYQEEYHYYHHIFDDPKIRLLFYGRIFTELLASDDFFRLCELPKPHKNAEKPFSKDKMFKQDCFKWKKHAFDMLDQYVSSLCKDDKERLLQLLLLNDSGQRRQISVHNALYGMICP